MPRRIAATPSDLPKIDLAGRYLEYLRLKEIVQKAERRASHMPTATNPLRKHQRATERSTTRKVT